MPVISEEYFDIVDDNNVVTGRAARSECHGKPELAHRAVHVLVFNSAGELYLQKRSLQKDVQPGKWDTSVGGHLLVGESYEHAAVREMREELGIQVPELRFLYQYVMRNEVETEFISTYKACFDGRITPDPLEISEGRFYKFDEIKGLLGAGYFSSNFEDEFSRYRSGKRRMSL
ncbi:MAG: NUDIX domain-containing protein [Spirochaetes bacterium]|jgi:isopentenyldiphosphate isomerase|nr:NUDIX domain-containing protein [Spirochaetota bacterium]